jgi:hypothetical protein
MLSAPLTAMSQTPNQAPNPPSAAEPQPKPGTGEQGAAPPPSPTPHKGPKEPQVAPEPGGDTPVNPDQSDG